MTESFNEVSTKHIWNLIKMDTFCLLMLLHVRIVVFYKLEK